MNYDILGTTHAIPDTFCTIKQIITKTLSNLCKTLQTNNNKTFNNLYNKQHQPKQSKMQTQQPTPCQMTNELCSCKDKTTPTPTDK
jgi:hypothetical protein